MKIISNFDFPPIGTRIMDWSAIDDSTYEGEPTDRIGYGPTREAAILDLINQFADDLFPEIPSNDLCSAVNPDLWSVYCTLKNRPNDPSFVWSEADVVQAIDEMYNVATPVEV
jgi:hypothetical protein